MGALVRTFRDLEVYQRALDLAVEIHVLTTTFPDIERYALADQLRRSSKSVCLNIAESWRKRRYRAAFVAKLSDAETEAAETQAALDVALRLHYLDANRHHDLDQRLETVLAQMVSMINNATRWCRVGG